MILRVLATSVLGISLLVTLFVVGIRVNAQEATSTPDIATSTPDIGEEDNATTTPEETPEEPSQEEESSATSTPLAIEASVELQNGCEVTDTSGTGHVFPAEDSPSEFLAICALVAAESAGDISGFEVENHPSFGPFVASVHGIEPDDDEFWALWLNGDFASCGIGCLPLEQSDVLSLVRTTFEGEESDRIVLTISALIEIDEEPEGATPPPPPPPSPPSGGGNSEEDAFDVPAALAFLSSMQEDDGSFGEDLFTDWTAIAFAAQNPGGAKNKLRDFLLSHTPKLSSITDYERHAMALMVLGINPYSGTPTDYIAPIVSAFDGTQIGESFVHDDIFALFPLLKAGYTSTDDLIQKAVAYIIAKQNAGGSWGDPDTTAAAMQALSLTSSSPGASDARARAKTYLQTTQEADGGFGNSFSTSWVLQAIAALGESPNVWQKDGNSPLDVLTADQDNDGGMDAGSADSLRVWATAYAVPAALGKTWDEMLSSFSKPSTTASAESGSSSSNSSTRVGNATTTAPLILGVSTTTTAMVFETTASAPAAIAPTPLSIPTPRAERTERVVTLATSTNSMAASTSTTASAAQVAAVASTVDDTDGTWLWLVGFGAILFMCVWLLRFRS